MWSGFTLALSLYVDELREALNVTPVALKDFEVDELE